MEREERNASTTKQAVVAAVLSIALATMVHSEKPHEGNLWSGNPLSSDSAPSVTASFTPAVEDIRQSMAAENAVVDPYGAPRAALSIPNAEAAATSDTADGSVPEPSFAGSSFDSSPQLGSFLKSRALDADQTGELELLVDQQESNTPTPIFLELSSRALSRGDVDRAARYYALFQLRTEYDVKRCSDVSAPERVSPILQSYHGIDRAIPNEERTRALRMLVSDRTLPLPTAAPLWLCTSASSLTPATRWPELWDQVVEHNRLAL